MKNFILMLCLSIVIISCKKENNDDSPFETLAYDTTAVAVDTGGVVLKGKRLPIDSSKIKKLKQFFDFKSDEFSEDKTTWTTPKSAPRYRNRNGTYCYFSPDNLRFVFQYHKDDWLFFSKCTFLIDGETFEYTPNEVKRDNDESGITEWFDEGVDDTNKDIIEAFAKAKTAKVKLIGDNYVDIIMISKNELLGFKRTLEYYKALGYQF